MKKLFFFMFLIMSFRANGNEVFAEKEIRITLTDNTKSRCGVHEACAIIGKNTCEIVAPKPKDYLDHWRMEILGHELWHCFNGKEH